MDFHNRFLFFWITKIPSQNFPLQWNLNFVETEKRFNFSPFFQHFFCEIGYFCNNNLSFFIGCSHIFIKLQNDYTTFRLVNLFVIHFEHSNDAMIFSLLFDSILHNIQTWSAKRIILYRTRTRCDKGKKLHKQQYFVYDICFWMKWNERKIHIRQMWLMRVKPTQPKRYVFFPFHSWYYICLNGMLVAASISMVYPFKSNRWTAFFLFAYTKTRPQ